MIHTPKSRDEWLALRKPFVTSTEVSALFGLSPYQTALELALLKRGEIEDTFEENDRTRWGTRLQDSIAAGISEDYGVSAAPLNAFCTLEDCRLGASFDWQIHGVNDRKIDDSSLRILFGRLGMGLLEIKNVDSLIYKNKWEDDEAPPHIELQLQTQLECSGHEWGVIAALVGGNTPRILIRERDKEVGRAIRFKVREFWRNLDAGILPPADMPEDADTLRRLYNYAEPGKLFDAQNNAEITNLCVEYKQASDDEKAAKDRKEVARAYLLEKIGDAEKVLANGYSISAKMIAPTWVEAYERAGFRDFRIHTKKANK
jgi:putative phage-type endonuclease